MSDAVTPLGLGEYLVGAAFLAVVAGASFGAAWLFVARQLPELTGAPRAVALGLVGTLALLLVHWVPGVLTILSRETVLVSALLLLGATALLPERAAPERVAEFPSAPPGTRIAWWLAGVGAAAVGVYLLAFLIDRAGDTAANVDMTTFHLPSLAAWVQDGSLWHVDDWIPHRATGTYPNTADLVVLSVALPWDADFLVRFVNLPFMALIVLAVYAGARELGASGPPALLGGALLASMPVVALPALEGLSDTVFLASYGSGIYFLLRHRRTRARSDLLLGALGLGLALGSKWYGIPVIALTIAAWAVATRLDGQRWRNVISWGLPLAAVALLTGGFWYLRNLIKTGNPVFPAKVDVLGVTLFDAPPDLNREIVGSTLAEYLDRPRIWADVLFPDYLDYMGFPGLLLWAALPIAAGVLLLRARTEPGARPLLALVALAAGIGLVYLLTPYSAQGFPGEPVQAWVNSRYVVPAMLLGAVVGGWAMSRAGPGLLLALEGVVVVAIVDGLRRNFLHVSATSLVVAVAVIAALVGAVLLARRGGVAAPRLSRAALAAGLAGVLALALAGGYAQQRRWENNRYVGISAPFDWVRERAASDRRVGLVGEGFGIYPMFGARFDNEVRFIGTKVDDMLRPFHDRERFEAEVNRRGYDLVLVSDTGVVEPRLARTQERWLKDMGYREVSSGTQPASGDYPIRLYTKGELPS